MKIEFREINNRLKELKSFVHGPRWSPLAVIGFSTMFLLSCAQPNIPPKIEDKGYTYKGDKITATTICNGPNGLFNVLIRGKVNPTNYEDSLWTTLQGNGRTIITSLDQGGGETPIAVTSFNGTIGSIRGEGALNLLTSTESMQYDYTLQVYSAPAKMGIPNLNPSNKIDGVTFATDCR